MTQEEFPLRIVDPKDGKLKDVWRLWDFQKRITKAFQKPSPNKDDNIYIGRATPTTIRNSAAIYALFSYGRSNKIYIGSTAHIGTRRINHFADAFEKMSMSPVYCWIREQGRDNIKLQVFKWVHFDGEICETQLRRVEKQIINEYYKTEGSRMLNVNLLNRENRMIQNRLLGKAKLNNQQLLAALRLLQTIRDAADEQERNEAIDDLEKSLQGLTVEEHGD